MPTGVPNHERASLLKLARLAIEAEVAGRAIELMPAAAELRRPAGAFVTLTLDGELRGCIGYPEADQPLVDVVVRCAVAAASQDPRFEPLTILELAETHIEISVLTPLQLVREVTEIVVGRDGLVVQLDQRRGLLLPQVAGERGWTRETFLTQTSLKAGLTADAWQSGAQIFRFEAEVFGEE